jgi:hypothetical protein
MSKIEKITKENILGIKPYKSKKEKIFNIGWRILFFVFVLVSLTYLSFRNVKKEEVKANPGSTITYNFSNCNPTATCPPATNCCKAYYGWAPSGSVPVPVDRTTWTAYSEYASGDYTNIASSNDVRKESQGCPLNQIISDYVMHINETPATINSITLKWEGYAEKLDETAAENDLRLYLLNISGTPAWELKDSKPGNACPGTSDCTMTYTQSTNISNYIDGSGNLRFLVQKYEKHICYDLNTTTKACEAKTVDGAAATALQCTVGSEACRYCSAGTCGYYTSGQHGCPTCQVCNANGNCVAATNTNWGAGPTGCTGSNQRCYNGTCYTCNNTATTYFYSDGCSGCAGQGGNACWRKGSGGQSCNTVCSAYGGCVDGNWDDTDTCDVGKHWCPSQTCGVNLGQGEPTCWTNCANCYSRWSGASQLCSATTAGLNMRSCVCAY